MLKHDVDHYDDVQFDTSPGAFEESPGDEEGAMTTKKKKRQKKDDYAVNSNAILADDNEEEVDMDMDITKKNSELPTTPSIVSFLSSSSFVYTMIGMTILFFRFDWIWALVGPFFPPWWW